MAYCALHNHSYYSFLDGFDSPKDIVKKAKELGHPAIAITDHGNVHGFVELYKAAKEEGIKPIFGCEFYTASNMYEKNDERFHLIVLAKNKEGLKNLFKLVTLANTDGYYYKPRIDFNTLKEHSEGLIVMTACLAGEIPKALEINDIERAKELALQYKEIFGDDFYIEIMANNMDEQFVMNAKLANLARELDIELVATSDMHYINREDAEAHDVMLAIQTGSTLDDKNRLRFSGDDYYFKDEEEVRSGLFKNGFEEEARRAVENTVKIAEKCEDIELELGNLLLPEYEVPEGYTLDSYLEEKAYNKLFQLMLEEDLDIKTYSDRLARELEVITMKGYSGYFLIVEDYIEWAKRNNIVVGPGRGSAAGSLLSYVLGITSIDPIKNGLLFERFLNPERTAMPDIDTDFSDRDAVINYVIEKYGREKVASICNFGTMAAKMAVKDVGRVLGYDFYLMNEQIAKAFPDEPGITIDEAIEKSPELRAYATKYKELFDIARKLEGKPRQLGTHASAVVIAPRPVTEIAPLARTMNNQTGEVTYVTQTEMNDSESLGLLKMDFLGLKTILIVARTIEFIHKRKDLHKFKFVPTTENIWRIPLDDKNVYKHIFQKADTNGVFQLESQLFKRLLKQMKPRKFEHLVALLALGRPGPLEAGIADEYIACMNGKKKVEYPHEDLKEILEETYGYIIYQEQTMQIARKMAGYSLGEADLLRRGIGKKIPEVIAAEKPKFIEGALKNGYDKELAEHIFELIEYFSGYGFNKSHSAAYAIMAYVTAYLKYYFPAEFYASLMSIEAGKTGSESNLTDYFSDCYKRGIAILPPDINESDGEFTAVGGKIRLGLNSIKGLGQKAISEILRFRPFSSIEDLYSNVDTRVVNSKAFTSLIKSGALDSFNPNRNKLLEDYEVLRKYGHLRHSLFGDISTIETTEDDIIAYEMETLGISITYPSEWDMTAPEEYVEIEGILTKVKQVKTRKSNKLMAFAELKTKKNNIKLVIFPDTYAPNHDIFTNGFRVKLYGKKDDNNALLVDKVELIEGDFFAKAN
ncbi:MAG TPA: DNA polymerase III subunit alpha [Fervidobacterium sp.]|nr:DNA polymerase III subunit alpha [Fervidobacterium sp.]